MTFKERVFFNDNQFAQEHTYPAVFAGWCEFPFCDLLQNGNPTQRKMKNL
jgi:hypothetical protein